MDKTLEKVLDILLKLDDRVLEVDLAHSKMLDSILNAVSSSQEISPQVRKKWTLVVRSHKELGKEIRQLLREINEIKHQVNVDIQAAVKPLS
jgi:hypothetical protein